MASLTFYLEFGIALLAGNKQHSFVLWNPEFVSTIWALYDFEIYQRKNLFFIKTDN